MAQSPVSDLPQRLVLLFMLFWAINGFFAWGFNYPAIYCAFLPYTSALYMAWGVVVLYCVAAYIALKLFRGQMMDAFGGAVVFFGIVELPTLADFFFRMGGQCNG